MRLDARSLADGATLEADLCVVGAGPAGLSLAGELTGAGLRVVLMESGGWEHLDAAQELNTAAFDAPGHAGLKACRHRQVGGTARIWNTPVARELGAKFVPLDALDFRGLDGRPPWPLQLTDLEPYYRRAHDAAGLGPFDYEPRACSMPPSALPADDPVISEGVYRFGSSRHWVLELPTTLAAAEDVTICTHATVTRLMLRGGRIEGVGASASGGGRLGVRCRSVVLACGGVETTRLLLLARDQGDVDDRSGWLGRGFMEHPRDTSLRIPNWSRDRDKRLDYFDARRRGGHVVGGRVAVREAAITELGLPNAAVTLLPLGERRDVYWRARRMARHGLGIGLFWPPGYGWSVLPTWARAFEGFQLLVNLEERPHHANRLTLDTSRDEHGLPRVKLIREWRSEDADRLLRLRRVLADRLDACGLGPVEVGSQLPPDPNSHHLLGTTRMGDDPDFSVTDEQGRVWGTEGLFVCSGALFPTAGYANPTLTLLALAFRLADRLVLGE